MRPRPPAALGALLLDALFGEPPARLHPTVWMGRWIAAGRDRRRAASSLGALAEGASLVAGGALVVGSAADALDRMLRRLPRGPAMDVASMALKPALSLRALLRAAREVEEALAHGRLAEARRLLAWHLVSRDTSALSTVEVAGAAVESIAENLNDSLVAPLLGYRLGGLAWRTPIAC